MVDTCHYKFVQTHRMSLTPRENLQVNYGLCAIMMCQCRLMVCNNCTTLVGDMITGEAMHVGRQGIYGKALCLPHKFAVNLKLL